MKAEKKNIIIEIKDTIRKILILYHGPCCEICLEIFDNSDYLIPCHILSQGAYPNMKYILANIVWACDSCHKKLDDFDQDTIDRLIEIRGLNFRDDLKRMAEALIKIDLKKTLSDLLDLLKKLTIKKEAGIL